MVCVSVYHSFFFFDLEDSKQTSHRSSNQIFIMWEYLSFAASQCDDNDESEMSSSTEEEATESPTTTAAAEYDDDDDDDDSTMNTGEKDDESSDRTIGYIAICLSFVSIIVSCLAITIVGSQRSIDPLRRGASVSARKV